MENIFNNQKKFFSTNITQNINFRIKMLKKLKFEISKNEENIYLSLQKDLNKSKFEAYETEIAIVIKELDLAIKNLKRWSKPKKVKTPLFLYKSKSYILSEPFGVVLIFSPWNYPFQLSLCPLISAISSGNCCILKLSELSYNTSKLIKKILDSCFEQNFVASFNDDYKEAEKLLNLNFDYIFFTGSTKVGKIIAKKASETLTPITLELGGKSPCIVDLTANLKLAAKRIAWGKFLNSGQTCVAPDYILVEKSIKTKFVNNIIIYIKNFFGENPLECKEYGKIINQNNFKRLNDLIKSQKILLGGNSDLNKLKIEPTLVEVKLNQLNCKLMEDEIFGPILPIIEYSDIREVIKIIKNRPSPLALYLFTNNKEVEKSIIKSIPFGGGCINDTIMHITSKNLPFGGIGESGFGNYHGKYGFETFSHKKSILKRYYYPEINLRYPPYKNKLNILKKLL